MGMVLNSNRDPGLFVIFLHVTNFMEVNHAGSGKARISLKSQDIFFFILKVCIIPGAMNGCFSFCRGALSQVGRQQLGPD
jgi:hypothetical protein